MGYFDKFNAGKGIPFMEGNDKMDMPLDENLTIKDFGFIDGEDGEYAVIYFTEYPKNFAFGNAIITDNLRTMEGDFKSHQAVLEVLENVTVKFFKKTSKKGRDYIAVEFIENDNIPF